MGFLRSGVTLVLLAISFSPGFVEASQSARHQIGNALDGVKCVVTVPLSVREMPGAESIVVEIRVPAPPDVNQLRKLPLSRRDYSRLPIAVYLAPTTWSGQVSTATPPIILPMSTDLIHRRVGVSPDAALDTFVRALFRRSQLKENVDIVAEQSAKTDAGEKVTAQTRCSITATDVAVWR